jgi:hypothetical protein
MVALSVLDWATVGDVNGDLYPDIYISMIFYEKDYLYINNKNGTFTEQIRMGISLVNLRWVRYGRC